MSNSTVSNTSDRLTTSTPVTLPTTTPSTTTTPTTSPSTSSTPTTSSPSTTSTTPITAATTSTHSASASRTTIFQTSTYVPPVSKSTTVVFQTSTTTPVSFETHASSTTSSSASASSTSPATLTGDQSNNNGGSSGLSTGGKTAVAVVVPVVVVALLVLAGIFLFRKRKQKKEAEELRRKEIQDYGYNPNSDPTLPSVMQETGSEMAEDSSGYRGWGAAAAGSNRKASTTLSGGLTHAQMSDSASNAYGVGPGSPGNRASDGNSGDMLMNRRETMGSDDLGALGVAPVASGQVRRGPSNASSAYSGGARSDHSDEQPPLPGGPGYGYDYNNNNAQYGYSQHGPYGDGSYGGGQDSGMPVVRDVSARRNTRIQQGGTYQQGNSGIAQNF